MKLDRVVVVAVLGLSLVACSDSGSGSGSGSDSGDDADPTTTVAVTGLCTVINDQHVTALFGSGYVLGTPDGTDTTCNWEINAAGSGSRGRIYLGGSGISYDKTLDDSDALGFPTTDVEGLGGRAHFTADAEGQEYWITIEDGTGTLSVLVGYKNGATPLPEPDLMAALTQLATEYLANV